MADHNIPGLNISQIRADILLAEKAVDESRRQPTKLAKYLRGQSAYHLQQATEKLIKIQLYHSGKALDPAKIYKHGIGSLLTYADDMGIEIVTPPLIKKNDELITSWEAEGRYDVHVVVRTDTLQKYLKIISDWCDDVSTVIVSR